MRTKVLLIAGVAVAGYVLGTRATRPVQQPRESLRHQLERLWTDPKARKRRAKRVEQLQRDAKRTAKRLAKQARSTAKEVRR